MDSLTVKRFIQQFQEAHKSRFTGRLDVETIRGQRWSVYFRMGRIVWSTGGPHRFRRWYRSLKQFCPEVNANAIQLREQEISAVWEYIVLSVLVKRKHVTAECVFALIESIAVEVLFDILHGLNDVSQIVLVSEGLEDLGDPLTLLNAEQMLNKAREQWQEWAATDFAHCSPNMVATVKKPDELQQITTPDTFLALSSLVDGSSTLRDLAVTVKKSTFETIRSLFPYVRKGLIGLQEIPDLLLPACALTTKHAAKPTSTKPVPLIACIDDSLFVCRAMEEILKSGSYRFVGVQDSVRALPILIEQKPDLILLDLVMPIANGYEICSQIRRIPYFKETPIIILSGNDGIVDRVRAKFSGATDFLAKPTPPDKVLAMIHKHLNPITVEIEAPTPSAASSPNDNSYEMGDTTGFLLEEGLAQRPKVNLHSKSDPGQAALPE